MGSAQVPETVDTDACFSQRADVKGSQHVESSDVLIPIPRSQEVDKSPV